MKCEGNVVFKSIEKREGGSFKTANGEVLNYAAAYVVKFDENVDGNISERKAKFSDTNVALYTKFKSLEPYTKINLIGNVVFQNSGCKLEILDFNVIK